MNIGKIFHKAYTPKSPDTQPVQGPNEAANQMAKEQQLTDRHKWLENPMTQKLLDYVLEKKENLMQQAINLSTSNEQDVVMTPEVVARKMSQVSTLTEIQNYVRTGKI